jgi:hypothetical protein
MPESMKNKKFKQNGSGERNLSLGRCGFIYASPS